VLTLAGGYAAAVKRVTLCHRTQGTLFEDISKVFYLLTFAKQFGCKSDGDEIAPVRDVKSNCGLLK
jgi:hypothetical protein